MATLRPRSPACAAPQRPGAKSAEATQPAPKPARAALTPAKARRKKRKHWYLAGRQQRAALNQRVVWRDADLTLCRERFPVVFDLDHPLPLAIGIHASLRTLLGSWRAHRLLAWWVVRPAYLASTAAGGDRYNLDASVAGTITEHQRAVAQAKLASNAQLQPQKNAA